MADISFSHIASLKLEVVRLACEPALNFYDLAMLLCGLYETDGRELSDLPGTTQLSRRRMYYLLRVGQLLNEYEVPKDTAEKVGWTKLQIIARYVKQTGEILSRSALQELLNIASQHKALDLPKALKGKSVPEKRAVQFYLSSRARTELTEALVANGATRRGARLKGKEAALIKMVRAATDRDPTN